MFTEGVLVTHPVFGPGRVVHAHGPHAWVYFPDVPGGTERCVKQLSVAHGKLMPAPNLTDPRLAHVPVKVVGGVLKFPRSTRISHAEALAHFLSRFPNGFADENLIGRELEYKQRASLLFADLLGNGRGRQLLADRHLDEIASSIDRVYHATNIPATQELMAVHDGLKDRGAAAGLLDAALTFIDAPGASTFAALVEAVDHLPAAPGRARVLTWPIVTLLPFLADPSRFIVLKPTMTRIAAERLFFDLAYVSRPNWTTYERTLSFAESLRELLRPHGARDYIDVQSFIWVTAGEGAAGTAAAVTKDSPSL